MESHAADARAAGSAPDSGLEALVDGRVAGSPKLAGLQVLVLRDGQVAYEYAGGFARLSGNDEVPLGMEHQPRVASISKLVAAIGLMRLAERGRIDLDTDVSEYLDFTLRNPAFSGQAITPRMLLSHTSSVRDGDYYWLTAGEQFEDFFLPGRPHFGDGRHFAAQAGQGPGQYFTYANLNFGIVAAIIERVSGRRFDRYMREAVLEPLGLKASFNVCDILVTQPDRIATLYRKRDAQEVWRPEGDWVAQLDDDRFSCHYGRKPVARGEDVGVVLPGYRPGENPTLFSPQGGLRASVHDLAVIARMLFSGGTLDGVKILGEESVEQMLATQWHLNQDGSNGNTAEGMDPDDPDYRPLFTAYGLSVQRVDLGTWGLTDKPRVLYGHLGDAYGMLGQFWIDPTHGDGLIALITGAGDDPERHQGVTPLYRPEEEIMRWWLTNFPR
ncbi:MAG: beta-lactamase family protein [Gammaproteobacteria bacterium]|nr:beta-lactamase family protein [Gammaproteobacteria bacterium]